MSKGLKLFKSIKLNNLMAPLMVLFLLLIVVSNNSCRITKSDSGSSIKEEMSYEEEFSGIPDAALVSTLRIPGQAIDLNVSGDYAYLTNDLGYLYVINVKDKSNPVITGICRDVDSANIVIVKGDYAYISFTKIIFNDAKNYSLTGGFYIVDISNKENPLLIGKYSSNENDKRSASGLFIDENYAYIITTAESDKEDISSLEIVDISIKEKPEIEGIYYLEGLPSNLWVKNDVAFLNVNFYDYEEEEYEKQSKILSIDLSDKKNPEIADSFIISSNLCGIYVIDDYAYVTGCKLDENTERYDNSIFQIIDVKDPFNLNPAGECRVPGGAWEMSSAGNYIYISILSGGIYAIDVSDSENPFIADGLNTGGVSYDVTIKGNYCYVADGFEGMRIIKLSGEKIKKEGKDKLYIDEDKNKNVAPQPSIEIFGDTFGGDYFQIKNPVYFSARNTFDPDGDDLFYTWVINDKKCSEEESFYYYFNEPGQYAVKLIASDGFNKSEKTEILNAAEVILPVTNIIKHNFKIKIEYSLINRSEKNLEEIECFMRIPQTHYPFQIVNNYTTNYSDVSEVLDNDWNLLLHFKIDEILGAGEIITVSTIIDLISSEFGYQDIECGNLSYDEDDEDLVEYTLDDSFIDSDNPRIRNTAESLIRNEVDTVRKAEIIYNFVIRNMHYDYKRAETKNYQFLYASEILDRKAGVCSDYAILYTALLRAAGIPSRLAAGIPVYSILHQQEREISMGHVWVEVKFPGYGWLPVDITPEENFFSPNYYLNILTERGSGYLYEYETMDHSNYYYDGFIYSWDDEIPLVEQEFNFSVEDIEFNNIELD